MTIRPLVHTSMAAPLFIVLAACSISTPPPARVRVAEAADSISRAPRAKEVLRIDEELVVRKIAEDAFVVTSEPFFASNTLVMRMPDGTIVLCSSPFETHATRVLVRWVRDAFRPPRIVAINTHFHFDGTGGNQAFHELGVETYGTALTRALLLERGANLQAASAKDFAGARRARVLAMKILPAEHTLPDRDDQTLTFGAGEVRVIYPGAAHSPDNLIVFFPSSGVLFGGCMVKGSRSVGFVGHADLDHWEAAIDIARKTSPRRVVPGHGAVGGPELFDLTVEVVRDARTRQRDSLR